MEEKVRGNVTVGRDLIEQECMEPRPERKEKMRVRRRKMEMGKMRSKMRVVQEYYTILCVVLG